MKRIGMLLLTASMLIAAKAQNRTIPWMLTGEDLSAKTTRIALGESELYFHIVPAGLVRLKSDAVLPNYAGGFTIPAIQKLALAIDTRIVGCSLEGLIGTRFCFVDTDKDGLFESYFLVDSMGAYLFTASSRDRKPENLAKPVAYEKLDPMKDFDRVPVKIVFNGSNGKDGAHSFSLCVATPKPKNIWGVKGNELFTCFQNAGTGFLVNRADPSTTIKLFGGTLTLKPVDKKTYDITIDYPKTAMAL